MLAVCVECGWNRPGGIEDRDHVAHPSLAMFCELLDAADRDLKGSGRLYRHPRSASRAGTRRNLYGAFIGQNVNASRILIVERASDRCKPDPGLENGRTRARTARGIGYPSFGERASM